MRTSIAIACFALTVAAGTAAQAADARELNVQIVLDMIAAINARDLGALDDLVAADVRRHSGATPGLVVETRDQFKAFLESDLAAVPDSVQTVQQIFGDGDMVALRASYAGTQLGPMGPFPPSGRRLELTFLAMLRLADGKIAEMWVEWDNLSALAQLGHLPPPATSAE